MITKTDICNKALLNLYQRTTCSDIDNPTSFEEKVFSRTYDSVRQDCIKLMCPAFAYKHDIELTCDANNRFWQPSDALRTIYVNGSDDYTLGYGNELIPNNEKIWGTTIKIDYIADVENTALFSIDFINFLALALASEVGGAITKDSNILAMVSASFEKKKASYGATNSQEKKFHKRDKYRVKSVLDWLKV